MIKSLSQAFSVLTVSVAAAKELHRADPKSPVIGDVKGNIDALVKFVDSAEQLEKGLASIATLPKSKKAPLECLNLLM